MRGLLLLFYWKRDFFSQSPQQTSLSFFLVRTRSRIRVWVHFPQDLGFLPNTGSKSGFS